MSKFKVSYDNGIRFYNDTNLAVQFLKTTIFTAKTEQEIKDHLVNNQIFNVQYGFCFAQLKIIT